MARPMSVPASPFRTSRGCPAAALLVGAFQLGRELRSVRRLPGGETSRSRSDAFQEQTRFTSPQPGLEAAVSHGGWLEPSDGISLSNSPIVARPAPEMLRGWRGSRPLRLRRNHSPGRLRVTPDDRIRFPQVAHSPRRSNSVRSPAARAGTMSLSRWSPM